MSKSDSVRRHRFVTVAILALSSLTGLAASSGPSNASPAVASAACAGANKASRDTGRLRRLVFCLHNVERRKHGLRPLRFESRARARSSKPRPGTW